MGHLRAACSEPEFTACSRYFSLTGDRLIKKQNKTSLSQCNKAWLIKYSIKLKATCVYCLWKQKGTIVQKCRKSLKL